MKSSEEYKQSDEIEILRIIQVHAMHNKNCRCKIHKCADCQYASTLMALNCHQVYDIVAAYYMRSHIAGPGRFLEMSTADICSDYKNTSSSCAFILQMTR